MDSLLYFLLSIFFLKCWRYSDLVEGRHLRVSFLYKDPSHLLTKIDAKQVSTLIFRPVIQAEAILSICHIKVDMLPF